MKYLLILLPFCLLCFTSCNDDTSALQPSEEIETLSFSDLQDDEATAIRPATAAELEEMEKQGLYLSRTKARRGEWHDGHGGGLDCNAAGYKSTVFKVGSTQVGIACANGEGEVLEGTDIGLIRDL